MGEPAKFTSVLALSSDDGRTLRLSWDEGMRYITWGGAESVQKLILFTWHHLPSPLVSSLQSQSNGAANSPRFHPFTLQEIT